VNFGNSYSSNFKDLIPSCSPTNSTKALNAQPTPRPCYIGVNGVNWTDERRQE